MKYGNEQQQSTVNILFMYKLTNYKYVWILSL